MDALKLMVVIIFLSLLGITASAATVTVTQTRLQTNSGIVQNIYYETSSGPGSTTPATNTALTPSGGSGSYTISAGTSGYLWSPSFSTATTIPSSRMMLDIWASVSSAAAGVDGSASASSGGGNTISIALTTTKANDVLYVSVTVGGSATVSSVSSSPSLTWTRRLSVAFSTNRHLEVWYSIWSGSGANTITITLSGSFNAAGVAFGISGANTLSPFDSNAAIPNSATGTAGTSATVTISTSNPTDLIIGALGLQGNPAVTTGSGFTVILTQTAGTGGGGNTHTDSAEYQSVTTTQTNLAVGYSWSGAEDWAIIGDAIVSAQPVSVTLHTTDSAGTLVSTLLATSNTNPLLTVETQVSTVYSIGSGSIPAGGYLELIIAAPASASITVYWGSGQQTNFQVPRAIAS